MPDIGQDTPPFLSPPATPTPSNDDSPRRLAGIDVARGAAVVAMALYHLGWDLSFYGLIAADIGREPTWQWAARLIAGSFLTLSGVSLALAHRRGIRWRNFLGRLGRVAGAALLITIATIFAFPDSPILFGILHCIAASSVLALAVLRAPAVLLVAAALLCFFAPVWLTQPGFDRPLLDFLGLGRSVPRANDYVPLLPWFAMVLLGVLGGRLIGASRGAEQWLGAPRRGRMGRGLAWAGRHSLIIYLIHQPILLALLYPVAVAE